VTRRQTQRKIVRGCQCSLACRPCPRCCSAVTVPFSFCPSPEHGSLRRDKVDASPATCRCRRPLRCKSGRRQRTRRSRRSGRSAVSEPCRVDDPVLSSFCPDTGQDLHLGHRFEGATLFPRFLTSSLVFCTKALSNPRKGDPELPMSDESPVRVVRANTVSSARFVTRQVVVGVDYLLRGGSGLSPLRRIGRAAT